MTTLGQQFLAKVTNSWKSSKSSKVWSRRRAGRIFLSHSRKFQKAWKLTRVESWKSGWDHFKKLFKVTRYLQKWIFLFHFQPDFLPSFPENSWIILIIRIKRPFKRNRFCRNSGTFGISGLSLEINTFAGTPTEWVESRDEYWLFSLKNRQRRAKVLALAKKMKTNVLFVFRSLSQT